MYTIRRSGDPDISLLVFQNGIDDFISKPCREDELLGKMGRLLNLEYEYDASNLPGESTEPIVDAPGCSRAADLTQLPEQLIQRLHDAVLDGNKTELDQLILQIRDHGHVQAALGIQELADKYDYDALAEMLEGACPQ